MSGIHIFRSIKQSFPRVLQKSNLTQTFIVAVFAGMLWFRTPSEEKALHDRIGMVSEPLNLPAGIRTYGNITSFYRNCWWWCRWLEVCCRRQVSHGHSLSRWLGVIQMWFPVSTQLFLIGGQSAWVSCLYIASRNSGSEQSDESQSSWDLDLHLLVVVLLSDLPRLPSQLHGQWIIELDLSHHLR